MEQASLTLEIVSPGDRFTLDQGAVLEILGPLGTDYKSLNNYSVVARLTYGDNSFLFTGDMEEKAEKELLAVQSLAPVDVLKVGHHGSSTSTKKKFLEAVTPAMAVIECGDIVCVEGDNQKQADFLSECLAGMDPARVNGLHMVLSTISLGAQLDIFEKGIAEAVDFSFCGLQGMRMARLAMSGKIRIGNIHTYLELYGRYFTDLSPNVCCIAAEAADRDGNLYTGDNTEDTPVVVEAAAFKSGVVIAHAVIQTHEVYVGWMCCPRALKHRRLQR